MKGRILLIACILAGLLLGTRQWTSAQSNLTFSITSISPAPGNTATAGYCPETEIIIEGNGFNDGNFTYSIEIGGTPTSILQSSSGNIYRVIIPPNVSGANVSVTISRNDGNNITSTSQTITVLDFIEVDYQIGAFCSRVGDTLTPQISGPVGNLTLSCLNCDSILFNSSNGVLEVRDSVFNLVDTLEIVYSQNDCPNNTDTISLIQRPTPVLSTFYYADSSDTSNAPPAIDTFCINQSQNPKVISAPQANNLGYEYINLANNMPTGLAFSPNSGEIFINGCQPGSYLVTFHPDSLNNCSDRNSFQIFILEEDQTTIQYLQSAYCKNDPNPIPTISGDSGTFHPLDSLSNIVFADSTTGKIDLIASLNQGPGPYRWIFRSSGACPVKVIDSLDIFDVSAEFQLPDSACLAGGPITVDSINGPGFFFVTSPDTTTTSIPIAPTQTQAPLFSPLTAGVGVYQIQYQLIFNNNLVSCNDFYVDSIRIVEPIDPQMGYPDSAIYCTTDTLTYLPQFGNGTAVGIFTSSPATGIDIDSTSGEVSPSSSLNGNFTIYLDYESNSCPNQVQTPLTLEAPRATFLSYNGGDPICANELPIMPDSGLNAMGIFSWKVLGTNGGMLTLDSANGTLDPQLSQPGSYRITFQPFGEECAQSDSFDVDITSLDFPFTYSDTSFCNSEPIASPQWLNGTPFILAFTSDPPLPANALDSASGQLTFPNCPEGSYKIAADFVVAGCTARVHILDSIQVVYPDTHYIQFNLDTLCANSPETLSITSPLDTSSQVLTPSNGFTFTSSNNTISYDGTQSQGTYTFYHQYLSNDCPISVPTELVLDAPSSTLLRYNNNDPICSNDSSIQPQFPLGFNGQFTYVSQNNPSDSLAVNPLTGEIYPAQSDAGTYRVKFTPDPAECALPDSVVIDIVSVDYGFDYGDSIFCFDAAPRFPQNLNVIPTSLSFFSQPILPISGLNPNTGQLNFPQTGAGTYAIFCNLQIGNCQTQLQARDSILVTVPDTNHIVFQDSFCAVRPGTLGFTGNIDSTTSLSAPLSAFTFNLGNQTLAYNGTLGPGAYAFTHSYTSNFCTATLTETVEVNPPETYVLQYNGGIPICSNSGNQQPNPILLTGTYSAAPLNTSTNQLSIDPNSGEINPSLSDPGLYSVTFTPASSECAVPETITVEIVEMDYSFDYGASQYCANINLPALPTGPNGVFDRKAYGANPAVSQAGLDSTSGWISPNQMPLGTYEIYCDVEIGACSARIIATDSIYIVVPDTNRLVFDQDTLCAINQDTISILASIDSTSSLASPSTSFGVNLSDSSLIYLGNATPGTYIFNHSYLSNTCPISIPETLVVEPPVAYTFSYGNASLCENADSTALMTAPPASGTYEFNALDPQDTLNLNPTTGTVYPQQSDRGQYWVKFRPGDGSCLRADSILLTIRGIDFSFNYGAQDHCSNAGTIFPTPSSNNFQIQYFLDPPIPAAIDNFTGGLQLSLLPIGPTEVYCRVTDQFCTDTFRVDTPVNVIAPVPPVISYPQMSYCQSDSFALPDSISIPGGTWSSNLTNFVAIDSNSGSIDLFGTSNGIPFEIYYTINTPCRAVDTVEVEIIEDDRTDFSYPLSEYCAGGSSIAPDNFSGLFSSPDSLGSALNPFSGVIELASPDFPAIQDDDTLIITIYHSTDGLLGQRCPDRDTLELIVFGATDASFGYEQFLYCDSDLVAMVDPILVEHPGGRFSSNNLSHPVLDSTTGQVDLLQVPAGDYDIFYTVQNGRCPGTKMEQIRLSVYNTAFDVFFIEDSICSNGNTIHPSSSNLGLGTVLAESQPPGMVFAIDTASSQGLSIDPTHPANNPGTYTIIYSLGGVCNEQASDTLVILEPQEPVLIYEEDVCSNQLLLVPIQPTQPSGIFTFEDADGRSIHDTTLVDVLTGWIYPPGFDSIPGNETEIIIRYQTFGRCPGQQSDLVTIHDTTDFEILPEEQPLEICEGSAVEFEIDVNSFEGLKFRLFDNGDTLAYDSLVSGETVYQPALINDQDSLLVLLEDNEVCRMTRSKRIIIHEPPSLFSLDQSISVEEGQEVQLSIQSDLSATQVQAYLAQGDVLSLDTLAFLIPERDLDFDLSIYPASSLDNSVGIDSLIFIPTFKECQGEPLGIQLLFNPVEVPIFIPEAFTPNGDGLNDTWLIQATDGVNAEEYTIEVFNRSHGKVYTMNGLHSEWEGLAADGTQLSDGVYWWLLYYQGAPVESGGVTIRRVNQ